jgi:hypothetical protein
MAGKAAVVTFWCGDKDAARKGYFRAAFAGERCPPAAVVRKEVA